MAVKIGLSAGLMKDSVYAKLTSDSGSILGIKVRIYFIEQVEWSGIALLDRKDCVSSI